LPHGNIDESTNIISTRDTALRNVLELIAKRLDNLEQNKYFPNLFQDCARFATGGDADSAAIAASKLPQVPLHHLPLPLPLLANLLLPQL